MPTMHLTVGQPTPGFNACQGCGHHETSAYSHALVLYTDMGPTLLMLFCEEEKNHQPKPIGPHSVIITGDNIIYIYIYFYFVL